MFKNIVKFLENNKGRTCRIISPEESTDYHFVRAWALLVPISTTWTRNITDQTILCYNNSSITFRTLEDTLFCFPERDSWYIHRDCDMHHASQVMHTLNVKTCLAFTFSYSEGFTVLGPMESGTGSEVC